MQCHMSLFALQEAVLLYIGLTKFLKWTVSVTVWSRVYVPSSSEDTALKAKITEDVVSLRRSDFKKTTQEDGR